MMDARYRRAATVLAGVSSVLGCLNSAVPPGRAHCAAPPQQCPPGDYCAPDDRCWPVGSGPPQHPTWLASYAKRPPFDVAGVDYAVGLPPSTTLTDWQVLSGPGITIRADISPPYVRVDGKSNVVISGVDFSLHGGASLSFINSPNATVTNCRFGGTNLTTIPAGVIGSDATSQGLTVEYCTIDGGGSQGSGAALVFFLGAGTATVLYNWFKNFPARVLSTGSSVSIAVVYKHNLIEQGALTSYLELSGNGATSVDVEYNTSYQTPQARVGDGFEFDAITGTTRNVTWTYNTMIATGGSAGSAMSYLVHAGGSQNAGMGHDNYVDTTAASGPFYAGSFTGWTLSNNYDMVTGAALPTNP